MPRPREFDPADAARDAMLAFLRAGFAGTSLSDLEAATGVGRKGLYIVYGSKQGLFVEALATFRAIAAERFLAGLEHPEAGRAEIERTIHLLVEDSRTDLGRLGCLVCNTTREEVSADAGVRAQLEAYFTRVRTAFAGAAANAVRRREIRGRETPGQLADYLLGVLIGVCVMARSPVPRASIATFADVALARLD